MERMEAFEKQAVAVEKEYEEEVDAGMNAAMGAVGGWFSIEDTLTSLEDRLEGAMDGNEAGNNDDGDGGGGSDGEASDKDDDTADGGTAAGECRYDIRVSFMDV